MNKVAITGATGFLGRALIKKLYDKGIVINAIARNEGKLIDLKKRYPRLEIYPCPVEDFFLLKKALLDCDGIFHLASFKDVNLAEEHPLKTIQSNIIGTINILKLTTELSSIKFVISSSTDKAVKVSGVYGATKCINESLFHEFHKVNGSNCKYRLVRYGNLFYSTGSVLEKWKLALQNKSDIILTNPRATRFFITREEAVDLMLDCIENSSSPTPFYPKMKSVKIGTLLEIMTEKYAEQYPNIREIGLQKGENMHEFITQELSSENAEQWSRQDLLNIL